MYLLVRSLEHEFILERFLTNFTNVKKHKNKKPYPLISPVASDYPGENTQQCNVCARILPKRQKIGT